MDAYCNLAEYVLMRGEYKHMFWSSLQIASWWQHFCTRIEEVEEAVWKTNVSGVEQTPLFYCRERSNYQQAHN